MGLRIIVGMTLDSSRGATLAGTGRVVALSSLACGRVGTLPGAGMTSKPSREFNNSIWVGGGIASITSSGRFISIAADLSYCNCGGGSDFSSSGNITKIVIYILMSEVKGVQFLL